MAARPMVDEATRAAKNLGTLRRLDPEIAEVLEMAGHVCVYILDTNVMQWEYRNIEGSLFVVKRRSDPRFQILVLNRNSTENLVENVLGESFAYELSKPYIMYTNDQPQTVHGIWFFDETECDVISGLLTRILATYLPEPILSVGPQSVNGYDNTEKAIAGDNANGSMSEVKGTDIITQLFNGVKVSRSSNEAVSTSRSNQTPIADTPMVSTPKLLTPAELAQKSSSLQSPSRQQVRAPKTPHAQQTSALSREQVRNLFSRLASNDDFIDIVSKELASIL